MGVNIMSIKSIYLTKKRLVELKVGLFPINDDLYETLNCFLKDNDDIDGEYLINVFDDFELVLLNKLDKMYCLFNDGSLCDAT